MSSPIRVAAPLLLLALAVGCERGGTRTITEVRVASQTSALVKVDATSTERFSLQDHVGARRPHAGTGKPLAWDVPPGWTERPDVQQPRVGSFAVGGNSDADCSIVLLPETGGGVVANVNRWRHQMGAPEISADEIAKLPTRPLLGFPAQIVEVAGDYAGMGGAPAKKGFKLLGAIAHFNAGSREAMLFVKLTGPKELVDQERAHFDALCGSIRIAHSSQASPHEETPEGPQEKPPLEWTAPPSWKPLGERPMRLVSFGVGAEGECYVSVLPAGGPMNNLVANLNRWRHQIGAPPLDEAAIAALPKVRFLGQEVPLIEAAGTFTDATAGEQHPGYLVLGAIGQKGDVMVFAKMVGPEAEVRAERERFLAFAGSIR